MSKPAAPSFRELQASFESRSKPTIATNYRSLAGDLANMSTQQSAKRVSSVAKSIDSVLDTPPASPPTRPKATLRPSWIGPPASERPVTPGVTMMKQTVTITHSSPGLQPPVYIFTSLSEPQWEAVEMHGDSDGHDGVVFSKSFEVEPGEYQYKFRLGDGDWWTCDESKVTVDDGQGNKNNLIMVTSEPPKMDIVLASPTTAQQSHANEHMSTASTQAVDHAPLLKHEVFDSHQGSATEQTPERESSNPFAHEHVAESAFLNHDHAPLLPHEAAKPSTAEQHQAPLFRHESISLGDNKHDLPSRIDTPRKVSLASTSSDPVAAEASGHDLHLEKFPVGHAGIMEKIRSAHRRLPEDQTADDDVLDSPVSQALSDSSASISSLPIAKVLEEILEAEEQEIDQEVASDSESEALLIGPSIASSVRWADQAEVGNAQNQIRDSEQDGDETVIIKETVTIEVTKSRKGQYDVLVEKVGGEGNAL